MVLGYFYVHIVQNNFTGSYLSLFYEMETKTNSFLEAKIC